MSFFPHDGVQRGRMLGCCQAGCVYTLLSWRIGVKSESGYPCWLFGGWRSDCPLYPEPIWCRCSFGLLPGSESQHNVSLGRRISRFVRGRSLMKRFRFLVRLAVRGRLRVLGESLEHPESLRRLKELNCDVALHAANVIYRQGAIDCFRLGILNAHIGILPEYRGRCVAEWSMLQGDATGITVFFIDTGIDTGSRIVLTEQVSLVGHRSLAEAKQFLFDQCARCYRKGLEVLMQPAPILKSNEVEKGHRYYPMSRLLSAVVEQLIGAQS